LEKFKYNIVVHLSLNIHKKIDSGKSKDYFLVANFSKQGINPDEIFDEFMRK
jgi:hypothetical protein